MTERLTIQDLPRLARRDRAAHKGDCGRVFVVAGSPGMTGAAALVSDAAVRAGAGLVRCAVPGPLEPILEAKLTEALTVGVPATDKGTFAARAAGTIESACAGWDVVVIGPGMGASPLLACLVADLLRTLALPVVIDADGLNNLCADIGTLKDRQAPSILTPHPGEMARLLGTTTAAVQKDRVGVAESLAAEYNAVVALKGHGTVVTDGRRTYVNPTGNPGMASGGTGDVLSGVVGALVGQGLEPFMAAALGAFVHGVAGDRAAARLGEMGMKAGDMLDELPHALRLVEA